jgi:succinate-acetate transporter protein
MPNRQQREQHRQAQDAIYLAMGEVLNEQFGRTVLPIGEPR